MVIESFLMLILAFCSYVIHNLYILASNNLLEIFWTLKENHDFSPENPKFCPHLSALVLCIVPS